MGGKYLEWEGGHLAGRYQLTAICLDDARRLLIGLTQHVIVDYSQPRTTLFKWSSQQADQHLDFLCC